jgi:hypothetical protein
MHQGVRKLRVGSGEAGTEIRDQSLIDAADVCGGPTRQRRELRVTERRRVERSDQEEDYTGGCPCALARRRSGERLMGQLDARRVRLVNLLAQCGGERRNVDGIPHHEKGRIASLELLPREERGFVTVRKTALQVGLQRMRGGSVADNAA